MKVHNVQQGTPEWHALRASHFTASEAPAMMGASKFQTRNDLLAMKKTGIVPDVTPQQQAAFDKGHATEEMARPLTEEDIGEELYPNHQGTAQSAAVPSFLYGNLYGETEKSPTDHVLHEQLQALYPLHSNSRFSSSCV